MELIATIAIMASVTWQVLIVAILAAVASKYAQVTPIIATAAFELFFKSLWSWGLSWNK